MRPATEKRTGHDAEPPSSPPTGPVACPICRSRALRPAPTAASPDRLQCQSCAALWVQLGDRLICASAGTDRLAVLERQRHQYAARREAKGYLE